MDNRPGVAKMSERMRKIAQIIVKGLALSAQATAWREGQCWEPEEWRGLGGTPGRSSVKLIR
jgi:hypothetical protein